MSSLPLSTRVHDHVETAFTIGGIRNWALPSRTPDSGGLEYVVAMANTKVLEHRAARLMGTARRLSHESGQTAHLYAETRYAVRTWEQRRRVKDLAFLRIIITRGHQDDKSSA